MANQTPGNQSIGALGLTLTSSPLPPKMNSI